MKRFPGRYTSNENTTKTLTFSNAANKLEINKTDNDCIVDIESTQDNTKREKEKLIKKDKKRCNVM